MHSWFCFHLSLSLSHSHEQRCMSWHELISLQTTCPMLAWGYSINQIDAERWARSFLSLSLSLSLPPSLPLFVRFQSVVFCFYFCFWRRQKGIYMGLEAVETEWPGPAWASYCRCHKSDGRGLFGFAFSPFLLSVPCSFSFFLPLPASDIWEGVSFVRSFSFFCHSLTHSLTLIRLALARTRQTCPLCSATLFHSMSTRSIMVGWKALYNRSYFWHGTFPPCICIYYISILYLSYIYICIYVLSVWK